LAASACATNTLRVEYAGNVAAAGDAAVASAKSYVGRIGAARRETRIELVVADPACGVQRPVIRLAPVVGPGASEVGALCMVAPKGTDLARALDFSAVDPVVVPVLDMVSAIATYSDALGEIVDDAPDNPGKSIVDAHETAVAAQDALVAVLGLGAGPIPGADDPRVKAVAGFIDFLGGLHVEAVMVDSLRVEVGNGPAIAALVRTLREHVAALENRRKAQRNLTQVVSSTMLKQVIEQRNPIAKPEDRRAALVAYYEREDAEAAHGRLYPALDQLLVALDRSDADFRRLLKPDPQMTAAEKARVREIARQRVVKALNLITQMATSFRGI
jgi:hypothetical protein